MRSAVQDLGISETNWQGVNKLWFYFISDEKVIFILKKSNFVQLRGVVHALPFNKINCEHFKYLNCMRVTEFGHLSTVIFVWGFGE